MLPGRAAAVIDRLATEGDADLRCIAVRMCRLTKGDVLGLVEKLLGDASPAVRREAAVVGTVVRARTPRAEIEGVVVELPFYRGGTVRC